MTAVKTQLDIAGDIKLLVDRGWTIPDIAYVLDVELQTVAIWYSGGTVKYPPLAHAALMQLADYRPGEAPVLVEPDVQSNVRSLLNDGWSLLGIAKALGVQRQTVKLWEHGDNPKSPKLTLIALRSLDVKQPLAPASGRPRNVPDNPTALQDLIRRLSEQGVSYSKQAKHLGVSSSSVGFWAVGHSKPADEQAVLDRLRELEFNAHC